MIPSLLILFRGYEVSQTMSNESDTSEWIYEPCYEPEIFYRMLIKGFNMYASMTSKHERNDYSSIEL